MRISDWSSDVCSSDLTQRTQDYRVAVDCEKPYGFFPVAAMGYLNTSNSASSRRIFDIDTSTAMAGIGYSTASLGEIRATFQYERFRRPNADEAIAGLRDRAEHYRAGILFRSDEYTSELQSLMRISYAAFCLIQKHYNITS